MQDSERKRPMTKQLLRAERRYQELHPSTVAGIPCIVGVIELHTASSDGWARPQVCFTFDILDRRGYPAPWLEAKLDHSVAYNDEARFLAEIRGR
jgi:hypothetical protein